MGEGTSPASTRSTRPASPPSEPRRAPTTPPCWAPRRASPCSTTRRSATPGNRLTCSVWSIGTDPPTSSPWTANSKRAAWDRATTATPSRRSRATWARRSPRCPTRWRLANPMTYVSATMAPILIQHGTMDCQVPYQQSVEFAKVIEQRVGPDRFELELIEGAGHADPALRDSREHGAGVRLPGPASRLDLRSADPANLGCRPATWLPRRNAVMACLSSAKTASSLTPKRSSLLGPNGTSLPPNIERYMAYASPKAASGSSWPISPR